MRRNAADILFVYHYTHRPFRTLRFSTSSLSLSLVPFSFPAPVLLPFPRFSFFLRSSCPLVLPPTSLPSSPSSSSSAPLFPVTSCIYFILLLNKPLPVILAPTCVFTRTRDPRQTQSPLDARIGLRATVPDTKNIFSPSF